MSLTERIMQIILFAASLITFNIFLISHVDLIAKIGNRDELLLVNSVMGVCAFIFFFHLPHDEYDESEHKPHVLIRAFWYCVEWLLQLPFLLMLCGLATRYPFYEYDNWMAWAFFAGEIILIFLEFFVFFVIYENIFGQNKPRNDVQAA